MADSLNALWQDTFPSRAALHDPEDGKPDGGTDAGEKPEEEGEDLGPCAARAKPKVEAALTIKHAKGDWVSCQYSGLSTFSNYTPHSKFEVTFHDDRESRRVIVTGRNLELIYMRLISHRVEWIQVSDRGDYAGNKEAIILAIKVIPLSPPRPERPLPSVSAGAAKQLTPA